MLVKNIVIVIMSMSLGYQRVLINEDGYGDFYCEDKNFAVYVKE